jgi:hypothetical protein
VAYKVSSPAASRPLPGETLSEFRDRQWREEQLQRDRDHDRSRGSDGRRVPIRYD